MKEKKWVKFRGFRVLFLKAFQRVVHAGLKPAIRIFGCNSSAGLPFIKLSFQSFFVFKWSEANHFCGFWGYEIFNSSIFVLQTTKSAVSSKPQNTRLVFPPTDLKRPNKYIGNRQFIVYNDPLYFMSLSFPLQTKQTVINISYPFKSWTSVV